MPTPETARLDFPRRETTPGAPAAPHPKSPTSERSFGVKSEEVGWERQAVPPGAQWGSGGSPGGGNMLVLSFCFEVDRTGADRERPAM